MFALFAARADTLREQLMMAGDWPESSAGTQGLNVSRERREGMPSERELVGDHRVSTEWRRCDDHVREAFGNPRERVGKGNRMRRLESRHLAPVFPPSRHGQAGYSTTAGVADRAVPVRLT